MNTLVSVFATHIHIVGVPMKHDPLGDGDNAVLRLAERGQLRLDGVV
jgi:hypothetical protein